MAVVPVFVSSTFRDFHVERDAIARLVTPALDEVLAPLGARVQLSDLRWGVDTSTDGLSGSVTFADAGMDAGGGSGSDSEREAAADAAEAAAQGKVLGICLREIEQSRPLFVGLLGDRFGWQPDEGRVRDVVAAAQAMRAASGADAAALELPTELPSGLKLSITALEFWSGALAVDGDVVIARRHLKGSPPSGWVDDDQAGVQWLRGEVARAAADRPQQVKRFDYDVQVTQQRDGLLGERIVADPQDVAAFAAELVRVLTPMVQARARQVGAQVGDGYASAAQLLAESRRAVVAGRDELIGQVAAALAGHGPGVVLQGPSGIGKTTVTLAVADHLADQGWTVASVLVGAGPGSTSTSDVIGLLAAQLGVAVPRVPIEGQRLAGRDRIGSGADGDPAGSGADEPDTVPYSGEKLLEWWGQVLADQPPRTLVVIDALDRLDAGDARDDVDVLRSVPVDGARVLASTTEPPQARALQGRGLRSVEVGELDHAGVAAAARGWAAAEGAQELPAPVVAIMAQRPRSGLWVRLAVDDLTWLEQEDYAEADSAAQPGQEGAALVNLLTREASNMPDEDARMAARMLERAERVVGDPAQAHRFLSALAVTRSGLAMGDLLALSGAPEGALTRARWLLRGQVVARDATGRLAFDHQVMRAAALAMTDEPVAAVHARLAQYLGSDAGGAADAVAAAADVVAVVDRVWHGLLSGSGSLAGAALERSWRSPLSIEDVSEVVAAAVVAGRSDGAAALGAVDALAADSEVFVGAMQQIGTAEIVAGAAVLQAPERERLAAAALSIARRLAAADPGNAQAARDVSVSLERIGEVAMAAGDLAGARTAYTEMHDTLRRLAAADPGNAQAARDVSMSLNTIGQVAMVAGDLAGSRTAYTESLDIARRLAAADPGNAQAARDLSMSLNTIGQVAMAAGDLGAARDAYTEDLDIARRLAAADPDNAQAARDLMVSLVRLAELAEQDTGEDSDQAKAAWAGVVEVLDDMDTKGWIMPTDRAAVEHFRRKATNTHATPGTGTPQHPAPTGFTGTNRIGTPAEPHAGTAPVQADSSPGPSAESELRLDESLLEAVGLGSLPPHLQTDLLATLADALTERVGTSLAATITTDQLAEFERIMDSGDEASALAWLQINAPDYETITRQAFHEMAEELRAKAPEILRQVDQGDHPSSD